MQESTTDTNDQSIQSLDSQKRVKKVKRVKVRRSDYSLGDENDENAPQAKEDTFNPEDPNMQVSPPPVKQELENIEKQSPKDAPALEVISDKPIQQSPPSALYNQDAPIVKLHSGPLDAIPAPQPQHEYQLDEPQQDEGAEVLPSYSRRQIASSQMKQQPEVFMSPNRFGTTAFKPADYSQSKIIKTSRYNPHPENTDQLTKLQYSVEQEQKRQEELQKRLAVLTSGDRQIELYDREALLKQELVLVNKKIAALEQQFKAADLKQQNIITQKNDKLNIEKLRLDVRNLNKQFVSRRDRLRELEAELEVYEKRMSAFELQVPTIHERLGTGAEGFDKLLEYIKEVFEKEKTQAPLLKQVQEQVEAQQKELQEQQQLGDSSTAILNKQIQVNDKEEQKLHQEIQALEKKKEEFVKEYEALYNKYQEVTKK